MSFNYLQMLKKSMCTRSANRLNNPPSALQVTRYENNSRTIWFLKKKSTDLNITLMRVRILASNSHRPPGAPVFKATLQVVEP